MNEPSRLLFGVIPGLAMACSAAVARPLCDRAGAPACGNIGQVGRPHPHALLLRAGSMATAIQRPLLDARQRPAAGNGMSKSGGSRRPPMLQLLDAPVARARDTTEIAAYTTGSRIAIAGEHLLAVDADSGALVLSDRHGRGLDALPIGREVGLMTYDPEARLAYVADRGGDAIVVVRVGKTLKLVARWTTPAEPYGVALTPARDRLLVSTIADRVLVAYDTASGEPRWRAPLDPEPRGIAIAPDGNRVLVASLASGGVQDIALAAEHRGETVALAPGRSKQPRSFARGSFTVAFVDGDQAVVPFQSETPVQESAPELAAEYYGEGDSAASQQLAFVDSGGQVTAKLRQPGVRALGYDSKRDRLYLAALGSDTVVALDHPGSSVAVRGVTQLSAGCGPDGLAADHDGSVVVWCAFTRSIERFDFTARRMTVGPELVASALTAEQHRGMVLFQRGASEIAQSGSLACATCHPDGRSDGLSWGTPQHALQTPLLAGRMLGAHPFKWDGSDATLGDSLGSTVKRLGGSGLVPADRDALVAYLEHMPAVRRPLRDPAAVARGEQVFEAQGCRGCHEGAGYSDHKTHQLAGVPLAMATPSLVGVAASAPYFHDGSAPTLQAVARDRGSVHGMLDGALTDPQIADLVAFLETR